MEKFYIFSLVILCTITWGQSLNCYVCSNCATVNATYLKSCEAIDGTTSTATNAPVTAPTTVTSSSVSTSTSAATLPTESTPTTASAASSEPTSTTVSVEPPPETNSTTVSSASSESTSTTVSALPSEYTSTTVSAGPTSESTTTKTTPYPPNFRKRKSADDSPFNNCICENGECDCNGKRFPRTADFLTTRAISYQCYTIVKTVNGAEETERGCKTIPDGSNSTACELLNSIGGSCTHCSSDECNSALSLKVTTVLLMFAFCLSSILT